MSNSDNGEKHTQAWGVSAGLARKASQRSGVETTGPRSLSEFWTWDLGGISLCLLGCWKCLEEIPRACERKTLYWILNDVASPPGWGACKSGWSKEMHVFNRNPVADARLGQCARDWGWLGNPSQNGGPWASICPCVMRWVIGISSPGHFPGGLEACA